MCIDGGSKQEVVLSNLSVLCPKILQLGMCIGGGSCSEPPLSAMSKNPPVRYVYRRRKQARSCSEQPTLSPMSENPPVTYVYRRKKHFQVYERRKQFQVYQRRKRFQVYRPKKHRPPAETLCFGGCLSASSSKAPSGAATIVSLEEVENGDVRAPASLPVENNIGALVSKSGSIDKYVGEESGSKEAPQREMDKVLDFCFVNDSCSSSQSDMELGSATGECSSSDAVVMKGLQDDLLETDLCVSILKGEGQLRGVQHINSRASAGSMCTTSKDNSCLLSCKVCNQPETTLKMFICDHCEGAFHASCCNLRPMKISYHVWRCQSCRKNKHKFLKEKTTRKSVKNGSGMVRCGKATSEGESFMLKGFEPYVIGIRIGKDFQAEVPDWSGPILDEVDTIESSVITPSESVSLHELNLNEPSRLSSIGNWLQCREVVDGLGENVDGNICGKWRRAPLFEVQTDDWECFRTVLWDPVHADCAVPQELDTDQVLKQLKYIKMLRNRLAAKRRKLGCTKRVGSQDLTKNLRKIRRQ